MFLEKRADLPAAHSATIARTRKMLVSERSRVLKTRGSKTMRQKQKVHQPNQQKAPQTQMRKANLHKVASGKLYISLLNAWNQREVGMTKTT